jgi:peptide deformylase
MLYPDPILRSLANDADPECPETRLAIADLLDTLDSHTGVGIAAPQIGVTRRIIVVDATRAKRAVPNQGRLVLLNPFITSSTGTIAFREGCLSIPDMVARVTRANSIVVTADAPDGRPVEIRSEGFEAVILQHEIDHLNGILFIDRVHNARDIKIRS